MNELDVKLFRSLQTSFPFTEQPVSTLATGFRVEEIEIVESLNRLMENGWLRGFWGEPNPLLEFTKEYLRKSDTEDKGFIRWESEEPSGFLSVMKFEENPSAKDWAREWYKIGFHLELEEFQDLNLLQPERRSTLFPRTDLVPMPKLGELDFQIAERGFQEFQVDFSKDFWSQAANHFQSEAPVCRQVIPILVANGVWKRFSGKFSPKGMGLVGSALARWDFAEISAARKAAQALSALQGTGDVCLRDIGGENRFGLQSLFLGYNADKVRQAIGFIEEQWGKKINNFDQVVIL